MKALRYIWRLLRGDVRFTNMDLPAALLEIMEGRAPPEDFVSNGNSFSPDRIFGCDLRAAGHFHDYGYRLCRNERDRKAVDYAYYRNLRRSGLTWWLARKYFFRVRLWGARICEYGGDESARPVGWNWWKLFFTRYMEW